MAQIPTNATLRRTGALYMPQYQHWQDQHDDISQDWYGGPNEMTDPSRQRRTGSISSLCSYGAAKEGTSLVYMYAA